MKESKLKKINTENIIINKNIAIIGHMGSGKTIFGKILANKLDFDHLDSDNLIEKSSKNKINCIFKSLGESIFRKIEEEIILKTHNKKNIVLSLGGGSILSNKVRDLLKKNYILIFLDVDFSILVNRLKNTKKRPLLANVNIEKKIKELDITRRKYYLLADIIIKNDEDDDINETIKTFFLKYRNLNAKNN